MTYKNSWITNHLLGKDTVKVTSECARARWKIENEQNNMLKHGGTTWNTTSVSESYVCDIFCLLNLPAFLFHGIQDARDEEYRNARGSFGRRDAFFWALRYKVERYLHDDWTSLFLTLAGDAPDG
jgi:hypothetical protein